MSTHAVRCPRTALPSSPIPSKGSTRSALRVTAAHPTCCWRPATSRPARSSPSSPETRRRRPAWSWSFRHPDRPPDRAAGSRPNRNLKRANPSRRQVPAAAETLRSGPPELRRATAALAITELVSWGVLYYSFPVVAPAMARQSGWSLTQVSGAFSAGLLIAGLSAPSVAAMLGRFGPRAVMTVGSILTVLSTTLWAWAPSVAVLCAAWMLIGGRQVWRLGARTAAWNPKLHLHSRLWNVHSRIAGSAR